MDCYSEYKYNHYQPQHNINHTYYNNNPSMRFGNTSNDNHHTQQQPLFYDGFSRHNHHHPHQPIPSPYNGHHQLHHLHHPAPTTAVYPSSPFDANNESNSQFYYSNMHQTAASSSPSSYYGNHLSNHNHPQQQQNPYDSYRSAPSNYRGYNYGYHNNLHYPQQSPHFQGHFYPHYNGNHAPADHFNHYPATPPSSTTNGTIPSIRATSSHQQHQQGDFNAPLQTTSPSSTTTNLRSNEFSSTSMKNDVHEGQNSDKSIENETKQQQEHAVDKESDEVEKSKDVENKINNDSESGEIKSSPISRMNEEYSNTENEKTKEPIHNNDNDNNNNNNSSSVDEEQEVAKKLKNESFNETENCKENHEDTSATDYSSEVSSRTNKNHRDNEKQSAIAPTTHINNGNRLPEHSNLTPHNFNDRSLTPIAKLSTIGYNHHYNNMELPHNYAPPKHRYPMSPWYSHDYYNNWISPDDRRHFPDSQSFFSSMRNNKKNHHFYPDKLHRTQRIDTSPTSIKRTKRKSKVDESTIKKDTGKELIKNLTPLPGFLQTFGQTEIGKFSEAFYISSDSPHYQYNNESDIDSPQPYDFDSLDGPIPKSFYMCGSENDSPMSNFSEIMCKDF